MLKHLALLVVTALAVNTGCVLDTNTTDTDSEASSSATEATTTDTTTTDGTTTSGTSTTETTSPTTTAPTTTETSTSSTTDTSSTDDTTAGTTAGTTGSGFGKCGWDPNNKYYACDLVGEDPSGTNPIECPDTLPAEGDACDGNSPITGVGCCLPDGSNYYCTDQGKIAIDTCGS
ncbi:hypothetical protein [Nannocystis punicea]|uniref:Uncharacterized protein n=1 Tax=Nannocystis punicea TaxID=2995304 RepID=A0ABY7H4M3_9BACT|nr:hypothetical protein [Nannocystis poenicansa]WAS94040.1 hypothetical protein O0S08_48570 [Nannocystis poenicansa]